MPCLLPDTLAALSGETPADVRMVTPPAAFGAPDGTVRRAGGKAVYGGDLTFHLDGLNFTVQWEDATIDGDRAAAILAELEDAWTALVVEGGWPAPVSSETWLLRVVLDADLGGSGYTTVYTTDAYPEGYPVTYLNPVYEGDRPAYGLSVAVHELGHMLQYRLRDTSRGRSDSWFWEATSEWVAERAAPELDTYADSTYWYAQWPDARFDRVERFHLYGMLLLDAYLDERVFGFDGIRDTWIAGEGRADPWDMLIAETTGADFGALIAAMAAEVAAGTLREGALYEPPVRVATHAEAPEWEIVDAPERYGTHYIDIGGGGAGLVVAGDVWVGYATDGAILDAPPDGPFTLVLTALTDDEGEVGYGLTPPVDTPIEAPEGCACAAPVGGSGALAVGIAAAVARRRRLLRVPAALSAPTP